MTRRELQIRQETVLSALLRGEVPEGFDSRSADLTIRVLSTKRRSEAVTAEPRLRTVDDFAQRFDTWAAGHPRRGCAHDDVLDFVAGVTGPLPEPFESIRSIEQVYRGHRAMAHDRRPQERRWVLGWGRRVWHLGPRTSPSSNVTPDT